MAELLILCFREDPMDLFSLSVVFLPELQRTLAEMCFDWCAPSYGYCLNACLLSRIYTLMRAPFSLFPSLPALIGEVTLDTPQELSWRQITTAQGRPGIHPGSRLCARRVRDLSQICFSEEHR